MTVLIKANESTAARRRVYFHCVDATDGITAEAGETGQPQISTNGAAFTDTGIGTIAHCGNGRYYADLTQAAVATAGDSIETRYKSANTAETPGDSIRVVAFDPYDTVRLGMTSLPNAAADGAGGLPISDAGGLDLDQILTDTTAILVDTGTTLQAELDAIQAAVITNAAGADIAADIIALKAETASIVADTANIVIDTNELQTDDVPGLIAALNDVSAADVNAQVVDVINVDALVAGVTIAESLRRIGAVVSYKLSGAGTGTEIVTDWANSVSTIVFTVDGSGNKSAVTFN